MAGISTARKVGIVARVATRVAARQAGRSRTLGAVLQGARVTLGHFGRVFHLLFLEVTGFFFVCFAVIGGAALWHEYPKYQAGKIGPAKLALAIMFMVLFAYFGVSSFSRAWKKNS